MANLGTPGVKGDSAHQAHRSTQTEDGRLPSLQTKDWVHTGSAGLSCLSAEHRLPIDQRDDSGLRTHTAHLYHRPTESAERGVLLPIHCQHPLCRAQAEGGRGEARLLSRFAEHIPRGWGKHGSPSAALARACGELLLQPPPAVLSSRPPPGSQAPRWTPTTSNIIPLSTDNRLISEEGRMLIKRIECKGLCS